jgi:GR25 family glycosyltransferase involved in LPS biosynthesis
LNLDERKDRFEKILPEMCKINLTNFDRFSGIKISIDNCKKYKLIDQNKAWKKNNLEYIKSATGCKMSHLEILKKYKNCEEDYIMIIEDDAIFEKNTLIYMSLALYSLKNIDWNILFLSINLKKIEDAKRVGPNLLKINKGLTTTAQIFNKKNIENIIDIIEMSEIEIDNTYDQFIENKYCVYPMCVYQDKTYSDINKKVLDYGKFHKKFIY